MRRYMLVGVALVLGVMSAQAQHGPRRGKIKEVADDTMTITSDGKDRRMESRARTAPSCCSPSA